MFPNLVSFNLRIWQYSKAKRPLHSVSFFTRLLSRCSLFIHWFDCQVKYYGFTWERHSRLLVNQRVKPLTAIVLWAVAYPLTNRSWLAGSLYHINRLHAMPLGFREVTRHHSTFSEGKLRTCAQWSTKCIASVYRCLFMTSYGLLCHSIAVLGSHLPSFEMISVVAVCIDSKSSHPSIWGWLSPHAGLVPFDLFDQIPCSLGDREWLEVFLNWQIRPRNRLPSDDKFSWISLWVSEREMLFNCLLQ